MEIEKSFSKSELENATFTNSKILELEKIWKNIQKTETQLVEDLISALIEIEHSLQSGLKLKSTNDVFINSINSILTNLKEDNKLFSKLMVSQAIKEEDTNSLYYKSRFLNLKCRIPIQK